MDVYDGLLEEIFPDDGLNDTVTPEGTFTAERFTFPEPVIRVTVTSIFSEFPCSTYTRFEDKPRSKSKDVFPPPPPPWLSQLGQVGHLSGFAKESEVNGIVIVRNAINKEEMMIVCCVLFTVISITKNI